MDIAEDAFRPMPIHLNKPELDSRVQAIADSQPTRVSRHAMAEAMLEAVCEACELAGNPEAWRGIGTPASNGSAGAQKNGAGHANGSVRNQTPTAVNGDLKPSSTGDVPARAPASAQTDSDLEA